MAFNTLIQTGNKQQSESTSYAPYIEDLQKKGYGALGESGMLNGFGGYQYKPAPMNDSMRWGIGLAQENAHAAKRDFSGGILEAGQGVTGDDIKGLMNPYLDMVGQSTLANMRGQYDDAYAAAGARAANGASFGGSGAALERAQLGRAHNENVGSTISGLLSGGYDRASELASANADRELNANIAADNAYGNMLGRRNDAMTGLLNTGAIARAYDQEQADAPWENLTRYMGMLPGAGSTKTTNTPQYFDPIAFLASIGTKAFGL